MKYLIAAVLLISTFAHADDSACKMSNMGIPEVRARISAESFPSLFHDYEKATKCFMSTSDDASDEVHLQIVWVRMVVSEEMFKREADYLDKKNLLNSFFEYDARVKR